MSSGHKDEDNSPKNLNDKNQQASSQKFRQLILQYCSDDSNIEIGWKNEYWRL